MHYKKPQLVILGTRDDAHVERVVHRLHKRDQIEAIVVDYLNNVRFSISVDSKGVTKICIDGKVITDHCLIWDRTKLMSGSPWSISGDERSANYAAQEWRALYRLLCGLNNSRVVNTLSSRNCMIKPYQQTIAAKAGFLVPKTIVTNDAQEAKTFHKLCSEKVVVKSLSAGRVKPKIEEKSNSVCCDDNAGERR